MRGARLPPVTLRTRLALTTALACALAVLLVALGLYFAVQQLLEKAQIGRLASDATVLAARVEHGLKYGRLDLDDVRGDKVGPDVLLRVSVDGVVVAASRQFPEAVPVQLAGGAYRLGGRYVVARPLGPGGRVCLTLVSSSDVADDAQRAFVRALVFLLPFAVLLVALVGWLVAGRLLRPVGALERAARDIGESGDLTRRVPGAAGRDELSRLAATLQGVFRQLARTRAREQEFVRAAAHDLRSPLAALQARVALALSRERDPERYRRDLAEVGTDLGRLSRLAEHLLLLARNPDTLSLAALDLRALAAEAVDRARSVEPDAWVDLEGVQVNVRGDAVLLGQAVTNLLQNAARHAAGAPVQVTVGRDGPQAYLRVQDAGPGVAPGTLVRLGEAFYRPDAARGGQGSGLGLAIVRHVADLHGGQLALESAPGAGFTATLSLPAV